MKSDGNDRRMRAGFTLTDLCIVLVMLVLLVAVSPALRRAAFEQDNRIRCASNLKNIAAAMITYSNTSNGKYPRTYFDPALGTTTQYTGSSSADEFGSSGPSANDVTGGIFYLLRFSGMDPIFFVCPSSDNVPYDPVTMGPILSHSNFASRLNLSYSFACPFPTHKALVEQWVWDSTKSSDDPLAADMNPGDPILPTLTSKSTPDQVAQGNSLNHDREGQNVLYGDYHVAWQKTPLCGQPPALNAYQKVPDNIYTAASNPETIGGMPQDGLDEVLMPVATIGPQPPAKATMMSLPMIVGGGVVLLLIVVGVFFLSLRGKGQPPAPLVVRAQPSPGPNPPPSRRG